MDSSSEIEQRPELQNQAGSKIISAPYKRFWDENVGYREGLKVMSLIVNIQVVVIMLLSIALYFYISETGGRHDNFFAANVSASPKQIVGLNRPNTSRTTLSNWVSKAMVEIMTFGFNDIDERFAISMENFTPEGWLSFRDAIIKSGLVNTVIENQQLITAAPVDLPVLAKEGIIKGVYSWVFNTNILITFRAGNTKSNAFRRVMVTLQKMPTADNPYGVGISEFFIY